MIFKDPLQVMWFCEHVILWFLSTNYADLPYLFESWEKKKKSYLQQFILNYLILC